jgi:uncharacterized protein YceK
MRNLALLFFASVVLVGCASVKPLYATGGSKSDGIVEVSYDYGWWEEPQVQWQDGITIATKRCQAWGYNSAEAFSRGKTECERYRGNECMHYMATIKYQCLGEIAKKQ